MKINEMTTGQNINQDLLINSIDIKTTKKQTTYLAITFSDDTGTIDGNLWDATEKDQENYQPGMLVHAQGIISEFREQLQLDIQDLSDPQPLPNKEMINYLPAAPESFDKMRDEFVQFTNHITNPVWHTIIFQILHEYQDKFFYYPAAKHIHHAVLHGLLFHTLSILRQEQHLAQQYPQLNAELMYAGAIIHDIGKTVELSGPLNTTYTTNGKLLGHISIMDGEICRIAEQKGIAQDNPDLILLRHMVLSHHGKLEYGSPVQPQLLEAVVLHHCDELDAAIYSITKALTETDNGKWSAKLWAQDNTSFLHYNTNEKDEHSYDQQ